MAPAKSPSFGWSAGQQGRTALPDPLQIEQPAIRRGTLPGARMVAFNGPDRGASHGAARRWSQRM